MSTRDPRHVSQAYRPLLMHYMQTIYCPRCGEEQQMMVHWWADDDAAYATGQTALHPCPVQPETPATPLW